MSSPWSNQLITQLIIDALLGNGSGLFVYSPTPGPGNLILSVTAVAGTDQFGNNYPAGLTIGPNTGVQLNLSNNPTTAFIQTFWNAAFSGGLWETDINSGIAQMVFIGGISNALGHGDNVAIQLNSGSGPPTPTSANLAFLYTDSTLIGHFYQTIDERGVVLSVVNQIVGAVPGPVTPSSPAAPESWHNAVLINSWGGSGSGVNGLFYRFQPLGPTGMVEIIADLRHATATGNSICFQLPAHYQPITSQNHPAGWNNPAINNSASVPWVFVDTSGNIQITAIEVANIEIFFHIFVPLESL